MTHITEILDQESGIQYQGVKDKSGGTGTNPIIGLIVGEFKRGRFDKPMTITNGNIKAMLGYDPKNPHYLAVQDALAQGVPSVQVVRKKGGGLVISCEGAPYRITLPISSGGYYRFYANGRLIYDGIANRADEQYNRNYFSGGFNAYDQLMEIYNQDQNQSVRMRIEVSDANGFNDSLFQEQELDLNYLTNEHSIVRQGANGFYNVIEFCLGRGRAPA